MSKKIKTQGKVLNRSFLNWALNTFIKKNIYLILVIIFIILLRVLVFEFYQVESCSMEETLYAGDIILVSKLQYGARLPMQPKDVPFLEGLAYIIGFESWLQNSKWSFRRMPAVTGIRLNDIIVFVNPQRQEEYLIKRCIGLPGDTLEITHNQRYVNGIFQPEPETVRFSYNMETNQDVLPEDTLKQYGISTKDFLWRNGSSYHIAMTRGKAHAIQKCTMVDTVFIDDFPKGAPGPRLFPSHKFGFTRENYGPIIIPVKNRTIRLNVDNIDYYQQIIVDYEKNNLAVSDGKIFINKKEVNTYTFKKDYFFMVGDNRYHSTDSRYWGFVPEDAIIGKVTFVLLHLKKEKEKE